MRLGLTASTIVLAFTFAVNAAAQDECDSDDWFCEDESAGADSDVEDDDYGDYDEDESRSTPPPPPKVVVPKKKGKAPPVVVYYPYDSDEGSDDKPKIIVDRPENKPKPPKRRHRRRHGLNLRLQGVLMGSGRADRAGMGGIGASYRYRPVGAFALDTGFDFFAGNDFNGFDRRETALSVNGMIFFNPKSKVQVYTLFGLGFSGAEVDVPTPDGGIDEEGYGYFGFQTGLGLEFLVGKKTALDIDFLGFIRGRTDEDASDQPEFVDLDTGRATNTSGGGLIRGGLTFYF